MILAHVVRWLFTQYLSSMRVHALSTEHLEVLRDCFVGVYTVHTVLVLPKVYYYNDSVQPVIKMG
jgi:hypothetical protein